MVGPMPSVHTPETTPITKRIVVTILVDVGDSAADGVATGSGQAPNPADDLPAYPTEPAPLPPRQTIRRLRNTPRHAGARLPSSTSESDTAITGRKTGRRRLALAATALAILAVLIGHASFHGSVPTSSSPTVTTAVMASAADPGLDEAAPSVEQDRANNGRVGTSASAAWWSSTMQQPSTASLEAQPDASC